MAAVLGLTACGSSAVPVPTSSDAARARARWPGADVGQLAAGRTLYVRKCSGCHTLAAPTSLPPEQWPPTVDEMAGRMHLADGDRELITRYLVTMSDRAHPPRAAAEGRRVAPPREDGEAGGPALRAPNADERPGTR